MSEDYSNERWCEVVGFPAYEISDHGRLRRKEGFPGNRSGLITHVQVCPGGGYLQYRMRLGTKKTARYIHRLVAEHFVEGRQPGYEVHHVDEDKTNNHASNLRWIDVSAHRRGHVKHDVVGKRYGSWTILRRLPDAEKRGMVEAQCDCGRVFIRALAIIVHGRSVECRYCSNAKKSVLPRKRRWGY